MKRLTNYMLCVMVFILVGCASRWGNVYKSSTTASLAYGVRLVELKQYKEALHIYMHAAEKESDVRVRSGMYNNIAVIYEALSDTENARTWYKKALELYPDNVIYDNYRRFTGDE